MGTKVTAMSEISLPTLDDLLYMVDDPLGTPASKKATIARFLGMLAHTNNFRLTLAPAYPEYRPIPATPNSTDTGAETTTFAVVHGWVSGTIVTPSATGGGLTAGTRYYVNATSTTTVSYHTTVADAIAATNKVNLTASITAEIRPFGVSNTTMYFSPHKGNMISVFDGTRWKLMSSAEISLALGTLSANKNYDVFVFDNSGTLTMEFLAWTDDTTRATALVLQDGVLVKSGATTRRYVGTFRTDTTTTTLDDRGGVTTQVSGKAFVYNWYNQIRTKIFVFDSTSSWTYATATIRSANNNNGNRVEFVLGQPADVRARVRVLASAGSNAFGAVGIGADATNLNHADLYGNWTVAAGGTVHPWECLFERSIAAGYHFLQWVETIGGGSTNFGVNGGTVQNGLLADVFM